MNTLESGADLWWPAPYPSSPLLLDLPPLFALLYFLFFLPLPLQFFRAKNKISSARALGKAALGLALARTDALNLQGFSACKEKQRGMDDGMEGKRWEGCRGLKPACISWGLGIRWEPSEEVSGPSLPGWLGNWPPSDSVVSPEPCQHVAPGWDWCLGSVWWPGRLTAAWTCHVPYILNTTFVLQEPLHFRTTWVSFIYLLIYLFLFWTSFLSPTGKKLKQLDNMTGCKKNRGLAKLICKKVWTTHLIFRCSHSWFPEKSSLESHCLFVY